jgi:hypothetical protein
MVECLDLCLLHFDRRDDVPIDERGTRELLVQHHSVDKKVLVQYGGVGRKLRSQRVEVPHLESVMAQIARVAMA